MRLFQVPFDYLDKTHVTATVNGVAAPFEWVGQYAVRLSSIPAANAVVELTRVTPSSARLVDFVDGSVLTERDLDLSALQLLSIAQEASDRAARALGLTPLGVFDARGLEIINVASPTTPQSVVTKKWTEETVQQGIATVAEKTIFLFVEKEPDVPRDAVKKYSASITGDGSTSKFDIVHNLNSTDVQVYVKDGINGMLVLVDAPPSDANNLSIIFAEAPAKAKSYRVIVQG